MSQSASPHTAYSTRCDDPVSFVRVAGDTRPGAFALPDELRDRIVIDVIHDGDVVPAEILRDRQGAVIPETAFWEHYVMERDWGASEIAEALARQLGLDGYWRVRIARVVMDFGRFPGVTHKGAAHLERHAINYPLSDLLGYEQKHHILEHYYDGIAARFRDAIAPVQVKVAIHTYDKHNCSGTLRPPVSLVTRSLGYQTRGEMPFGAFDPLFPDILGEFTCDRILRDRLSLTLERAGIHTEHNYPYLLPDGSVEVRSQVWNFFRITRDAFESEYPESRGEPAFGMVWEMLLDTNLRSSESEMLRSYLHAFRRVPAEREAEFVAARRAYEKIGAFIRRDDSRFVDVYRHMRTRPSALGIEVRKDLAYALDERGRPVEPQPRKANEIAACLARAIHVYFTEDVPGLHTLV